MEIQFSSKLRAITLTFATADFQQLEVPTTVKLTAFVDSIATPAVGSASAHGTYATDTMPMGTLSFTSATPFNVVKIEIPWQSLAASGYLVDNVLVDPIPDSRARKIHKRLRAVVVASPG